MVVFGSAPDTGASLSVDCLHIAPPCGVFCVDMAAIGVEKNEILELTVTTKSGPQSYTATIHDDQMHKYTFDLSEVSETIYAIRLVPKMRDCVLAVRSIEFLNEKK